MKQIRNNFVSRFHAALPNLIRILSFDDTQRKGIVKHMKKSKKYLIFEYQPQRSKGSEGAVRTDPGVNCPLRTQQPQWGKGSEGAVRTKPNGKRAESPRSLGYHNQE